MSVLEFLESFDVSLMISKLSPKSFVCFSSLNFLVQLHVKHAEF